MTPKQKLNDFKKEKPKIFKLKVVVIILFLSFILISTGKFDALQPLWMVSLFISVVKYSLKTPKYEIKKAGLEGEAKAQDILETLKTQYGFRIFSNIRLEKQNAEMDFVVVGEKTINVIEIKNSRGEFTGKPDDKYLKRTKKSNGGKTYTKKFYNPIRQVKTHVFKLSEFLKNHGINEWINHKITFVNSEATLMVYYEHLYSANELRTLIKDIIEEDKKGKIISRRSEICTLLGEKGYELV